jgi:hypothetical protein
MNNRLKLLTVAVVGTLGLSLLTLVRPPTAAQDQPNARDVVVNFLRGQLPPTRTADLDLDVKEAVYLSDQDATVAYVPNVAMKGHETLPPGSVWGALVFTAAAETSTGQLVPPGTYLATMAPDGLSIEVRDIETGEIVALNQIVETPTELVELARERPLIRIQQYITGKEQGAESARVLAAKSESWSIGVCYVVSVSWTFKHSS